MHLTGIGVCAGRAVGPVAGMGARPLGPPPTVPAEDFDHEMRRLAAAIGRVAAELRRRAARTDAPPGVADILTATALIAEDPSWSAAAVQLIEEDRIAAQCAFWRAAEQFRATLSAAGGYFAERVRDVDDVRDRVIAELAGTSAPGIPDRDAPFILVARDLAPADTATLRRDAVLAFVTEEGGPTSHTAILARALGIPAVVACPGVTGLADDTVIAVDGGTGRVLVRPAAVGEPAPDRRGTTYLQYGDRLRDGTAVALLANIGDAVGARHAEELRVGGVGLLRTEFLFGDRSAPPDFDEQVRVYGEVFECFPGGRVVVRTLDAGSDKPLPFLTTGEETNPALGMRGLRAMWARPHLLDTQLEAVAEAARRAAVTGTTVWTMAPMIATPREAAEFVARARSHDLEHVGVMVEIPSAAVLAAELLQIVDFVSIGTNDLAQYAFAADRMVGALAQLNDPWQPGLLRLIEMVGAAGRRSGKPVGVCGEAAADPLLALVLVGLGVTSLSAHARSLPAVAARLEGADASMCARLAELALGAPDPVTARRLVAEALDELSPDACRAPESGS